MAAIDFIRAIRFRGRQFNLIVPREDPEVNVRFGLRVLCAREAGANKVDFQISSPPLRFPCFYGIDMPTKEELIGSRKTIDEIREHLNVDSLGYLSLEGMTGAVAEAGPFCHACFSGDYTAPLVDLERGLPAMTTC